MLIHLSSPEQEVAKYFHGAIVESGPFSAVYRSAHDGLIQSESFGGYLGCPKLVFHLHLLRYPLHLTLQDKRVS